MFLINEKIVSVIKEKIKDAFLWSKFVIKKFLTIIFKNYNLAPNYKQASDGLIFIFSYELY